MYRLIALLLLTVSTTAFASQTILFGSCLHQDKPAPIFNAINKEEKSAFIFLGDNIYGDTEDMALLQAKYNKLNDNAGFTTLKHTTDVYAIWDDHDYGENDAGREYPQKHASKQLFLDFWGVPDDSPRRDQPDGLYGVYWLNHGDKKVQLLLPDLRWNRTDLAQVGRMTNLLRRVPNNQGPYKPSEEPGATMLGDAQWQWFEAQLQQPADLRIIGSSLQVLADFTGWESWMNYPNDLNRLFSVIEKHQVNGVLLISGDTHWGEISRLDDAVAYPVFEVTSSGLTQEWKQVSPNRYRIGEPTANVNYGFIDIAWEQADPLIRIGLKDVNGDVVMAQQLSLSTISRYPVKETKE